jgi:hypothetical protein
VLKNQNNVKLEARKVEDKNQKIGVFTPCKIVRLLIPGKTEEY